MASNGTRKRMKVRWMAEAAGDGEEGHAFPLMTGGVVRDYTLCGLPLKAMHLWVRVQPGHGVRQCHVCKQSMQPGVRA